MRKTKLDRTYALKVSSEDLNAFIAKYGKVYLAEYLRNTLKAAAQDEQVFQRFMLQNRNFERRYIN